MTDQNRTPRHIAFIMDGNGRWAQKRGLPRTAGHKEGSKTLKTVVSALVDLGVEYATFYAFSTENWKRPKDEVDTLMSMFSDYLDDVEKNIGKADGRLRFIGDRNALDASLRDKINRCEKLTENSSAICVCLAINYGGRDEITHMAKSVAELAKYDNFTPDMLNEQTLDSLMYTHGMPDVDLLIRTGGEKRLSNFLLWQSAYAELYFTDTLWPDFGKTDLAEAIGEYSRRNRRFGGLK